MEITYEMTEKDFLNFNVFYFKETKNGKKNARRNRFAYSVVLFAVSLFLCHATDESSFIYDFVYSIIISLIGFSLFPFYFYYSIKRAAKRMIEGSKNEGFLGEHRLIFYDEEFIEVTSVNETKVKWSGIVDFFEDENYFYLFNNSFAAYVIPKSFIADVESVRNLFQEKIQSSKHK